MPVVAGEREYPKEIEKELGGVEVDALSLAVKAGNSKTANSVMLGAFCKVMNLDKDKFSSALVACIPQKTIEMNKKAFEYGYESVK